MSLKHLIIFSFVLVQIANGFPQSMGDDYPQKNPEEQDRGMEEGTIPSLPETTIQSNMDEKEMVITDNSEISETSLAPTTENVQSSSENAQSSENVPSSSETPSEDMKENEIEDSKATSMSLQSEMMETKGQVPNEPSSPLLNYYANISIIVLAISFIIFLVIYLAFKLSKLRCIREYKVNCDLNNMNIKSKKYTKT